MPTVTESVLGDNKLLHKYILVL